MALGCGRSTRLVARSVWGKKSLLLEQYLIFYPLPLLPKLLGFQKLVRTRQASVGVCAYTAYWAHTGPVVSSLHVFSVKTLRTWNCMKDPHIQALLITNCSQVNMERQEFSYIFKPWKCTWPGHRVSIAASWGCSGSLHLLGIASQLSATLGAQPILHTHLLFCKLSNACLHVKKKKKKVAIQLLEKILMSGWKLSIKASNHGYAKWRVRALPTPNLSHQETLPVVLPATTGTLKSESSC